MSDIPTTISTEPKLRIEELFVAMLTADPKLAGVTIVAASDRDALVPPNHVFIYCTKASPILSAGQNYRADVSIGIVSNIDDSNHAARKQTAKNVLTALTRREIYAKPDATLLGWPITEISEVSTDQQAADLIQINAAAYVAG